MQVFAIFSFLKAVFRAPARPFASRRPTHEWSDPQIGNDEVLVVALVEDGTRHVSRVACGGVGHNNLIRATVTLACGAGHNSQVKRATGLRCWP